MNLIAITRNITKELSYFYLKHKTGFIEIETLYSTTFPRSHSRHRGLVLFEYAKHSKAAIVEIGSWGGAGSIALGEGSLKGNKQPVFCIDNHREYKTKRGFTFDDTTEIFKINVSRSRASTLIYPVFNLSGKALRNWKRPIGFLFLDTPKEFQNTAIKKWKKFVIENGFIISPTTLNEFDLKFLKSYDGLYCYTKVK